MSNTILLIVMLVLVTANIVATAQSKRTPLSSCEHASLYGVGVFRGSLSGDFEFAEPITQSEVDVNFDGRTQ